MMFKDIAVNAPSRAMARRVAESVAENREHTIEVWLGYKPEPHLCFVNVRITDHPWGWTGYHGFGTVIDAEGTAEEIFSIILPHEVSHTVIASHFNFNPPRWLDEGVAITHEANCPARLNGRWGSTPFTRFFDIQDYPQDWEPYYGQCYSVTTYLVQRYGRDLTFEFARQGNNRGYGYARSCRKHFGTSLQELEREWRIWQSAREARQKGKGQVRHKDWYEVDSRRRRVAYQPVRAIR